MDRAVVMRDAIIDEIFCAMARRGQRQVHVARLAGITPEALSRLKRSRRADFDTVLKLADAVDLDIVARPAESLQVRLERGFF